MFHHGVGVGVPRGWARGWLRWLSIPLTLSAWGMCSPCSHPQYPISSSLQKQQEISLHFSGAEFSPATHTQLGLVPVVALYPVKEGDVCPGVSFAAKGPSSQTPSHIGCVLPSSDLNQYLNLATSLLYVMFKNSLGFFSPVQEGLQRDISNPA